MNTDRAPQGPMASVQCPRCPSDTADYELIKDSRGLTIATIYTCRVCAIAWDDSGYIEEPEEFRPKGDEK